MTAWLTDSLNWMLADQQRWTTDSSTHHYMMTPKTDNTQQHLSLSLLLIIIIITRRKHKRYTTHNKKIENSIKHIYTSHIAKIIYNEKENISEVILKANSLRMHYIAVHADCNVVHPEAVCSPHGLQIASGYTTSPGDWYQTASCLVGLHRC